MATCVALNSSGRPCRAAPLRDGAFCRMHDPEQAAEVAEARRLGGRRRRHESTIAHMYDMTGLEAAEGLRRLLEIAAYDTLGQENSIGRSRVLAQIVSVGIRLQEVTSLEERLRALEGRDDLDEQNDDEEAAS